ncbi:LysR substrate-binding domain-containing protein [Methylobacterium sp. OT2]|uniref:LysR family transcriptional regulator n=1 Tax=Methylobacterium sp. OT2 TaxID=2813779 RepID=UPI00197B7CA2|nr:LysR substrate-binding domain-containing protein [Methylobacterium sp. OT2]MBN4096016.1 LysR family transcriptional regulator [Methylobacterium sp. OT2]
MTRSDPMFLDAKLLRSFCVAAEELHFGRAAARVGLSQPPFSQQIRQLEEQVGTPLFVRTTRSVRLTPAGKVLSEHARGIAQDTRAMLRAVRLTGRGEAGTLIVGLTPTAACSPLAEALHRYRTAHPEVELDLREMNSNVMESALRSHEIDVALMRPMSVDADIRMVEVLREPMVLAMRRDHPWAASPAIPLDQVAGVRLVGYDKTVSPYFQQMLQGMFARAGLRPNIVQESVVPTILTLVEAGIGVAVVPWTLTRGRGGGLAFVPLGEPSDATALTMAANLQDRSDPSLKRFIEILRDKPFPTIAAKERT